MKLKEFIRQFGKPYSERLGIYLRGGRAGEIFKWFLASILYGKPIRESSATRTYRLFEERGILSPEKIIETGWNGLVEILDDGGYTRYDFSTATKLLNVVKTLKERYGGDLNRLHAEAADAKDLEARVMALGKGIGPVTASIFLRDMRPIWRKADPSPTPLVAEAMNALGMRDLKSLAKKKRLSLVQLETALTWLAKEHLRKGRGTPIEG